MDGFCFDKLNIITTISSGSRTDLYLVADDAGALFVYKKIKGADRTKIYQKISESNAKCFPKIIEMCYRDGTTHVLEEYIEGKDLGSLLKNSVETLGYEGNHTVAKHRDKAEHNDDTEQLVSSDNRDIIEYKKAVSISRQLMQAVAILHGMNPPIIHRDIKPENILITEDGRLYLIDFDATREYSEEKRAQDTVLLGTRGYAAPEQFGFNQTDVRSDIYSIGVVCTQIFEKTDATPEQKAKLKTCFSKASMFDPSDRYADISEMLKAFEQAVTLEKHEKNRK
nr:protein kinase [Lachnospiraceae bacterium]